METTSDLSLKRVLWLLRKKKILFALSAGVVMAVIAVSSYLLPKTYEAKSVIFIERNVLNELIKNVTVTSSLEEKIRALSVIMKSRSLILKVMSDLDLDMAGKDAEAMVRNFQEKTVITMEMSRANQRDMDLFIVSYTHSDPLLASNYVNNLVRRYIEENLSLKREQSFGASRFLLDQLSTFKIKLDKIEASIARQKRNNSGPEQDMSRYDLLQSLVKKKSELMAQYTENHPEVMKLKTEIELVKEQIKTAPTGPKLDMMLLDLERERETTKKIYEDLLATLRKSEVSTQMEIQDKVGAFRVIDPAVVPARAKSPNMANMILLAIFGGIGAGLALIVAVDRTDNSVKSVEIMKKMGLPILAVISTMQTEKEAAAIRRKDRVIYAIAGLYLACFLLIAAVEAAGLLYVENFVKETRVEIGNTVKKIRQKT